VPRADGGAWRAARAGIPGHGIYFAASEDMSYVELGRAIARSLGKPLPRSVRLPGWSMRTIGRFGDVFRVIRRHPGWLAATSSAMFSPVRGRARRRKPSSNWAGIRRHLSLIDCVKPRSGTSTRAGLSSPPSYRRGRTAPRTGALVRPRPPGLQRPIVDAIGLGQFRSRPLERPARVVVALEHPRKLPALETPGLGRLDEAIQQHDAESRLLVPGTMITAIASRGTLIRLRPHMSLKDAERNNRPSACG